MSLHVFRSARRHLKDAHRCNDIRGASPIPSVKSAADEAYARTIEALVHELDQLERLGAMDRIEAYLKDPG